MKRRWLSTFLTVLLLLTAIGSARCEDAPIEGIQAVSAMAEAPQVVDAGLTLGIHSVRYPQLSGLADAAIEADLNARILSAGGIENRLNRLAAVMSMETPFEVSWRGTLENGVFSCAISALGPVFDGRSTQVWSCVSVDTLTGADVSFSDLFTDETAAREAMERILTEDVAPGLSAHLENGMVTPIPDSFSLSAQGITLYYPIEQLSTLSGRAGAVTILWHELRDCLLLGEDTILRRIGAEDSVTLCGDSAGLIRAAAAQGSLPGIPATIGDSVPALIQTYRKLFDPDLFEGGRLITLEDGAFRQVSIITDALSGALDNSEVQGIRADNLCFFGLCTGQTTPEAWRAVLGPPDATLALSDAQAEAYRLEAGVSDYYLCGEYRLRLHAGPSGSLETVILTR